MIAKMIGEVLRSREICDGQLQTHQRSAVAQRRGTASQGRVPKPERTVSQ